MSKPEDIPQDDFDMAEIYVIRFGNNHQAWGALGRERVEGLRIVIARAIMAAKEEEREACAQVANTALYCPVSDGECINTRPEAAYYMAEKIMNAIRKRGEG